MSDIITSRPGRRGSGRGRKAGRGTAARRSSRPDFDRLEARRLLATAAPPVAEFPLRQFGGIAVGVTTDSSGNTWVLLEPGTIAEYNSSQSLLAQYQVPTYDALGAAPAQTELGLITYDPTDHDVWFYESNANQFASLDTSNGTITEYPFYAYSSNPGLYQIVAGPDGNLYFTEPSLNAVGMFDIKTDRVSQFPMPLADTQPQGITVGGDGNLWFTDGGQNKITSLDPTTHVITNYAFEPPSHTTNDQAEGITAGPDDTLWFVTQQNNLVNEFDISSGEFTNQYVPYWPPSPPNGAPPTPFNAELWSIAMGADDNIYYTEPFCGWVGYIDPTGATVGRIYAPNPLQGTSSEATLSGAVIASAPLGVGSSLFVAAPKDTTVQSLYLLGDFTPSSGPNPNRYTGPAMPSVITTTDANDVITVGSDLYFTDSVDGVGQIGEFNPTTLSYTVYQIPQLPGEIPAGDTNPTPRDQYPNQLTVDSNGNIWFTETDADVSGEPTTGAIGEFDPSTGQFTQSYLTSSSSDPVGIAWDSATDEQQFWITEPSANELISYNPATTGSAVAPILSPPGGVITDPAGILYDPTTGYLWIAEQSADKIIAYDPANESILFSYSTKGSPNQLVWGPDGNIWFTESGYVGVLVPPTGPGTGSIKAEIPVSGTAVSLAVGPGSGTYEGTIWYTLANSPTIGEINVATEALVQTVSAPDTNANFIAPGPDGNMWFTSGAGSVQTPSEIGAVVLNPADLGATVDVTTQPTDTEETIFGGTTYGFGFTVAVENGAGQVDPFVQQGSITITLLNNPSSGLLDQTTSVTLPIVDGVANFEELTINKPGAAYTLQAAYSLGLNTTATDGFNVAGPATQLVVTTQPPSSVGAGVGFAVTVKAEDANGLVVPTFVDPIQLSILNNPSGDGVLDGTTILGALYGTSAFTGLTIDQAGVGYTLQAVDPNTGSTLTAAVSDGFTITAGPAYQLVFSSKGEPPSSASAGQNLAGAAPLVVDVEDQFGYVNQTFDGPVTLVLANNASGTLAGSTLTVNAVDGVATFTNVAIETAGTFMLAATGSGLKTGDSTAITISPAAAYGLKWTTQPPSTVTDAYPFGAAVEVVDQYGNVVTSDSQVVSIALDLNGNPDATDLGGTISVAAVEGVATFSDLIINAVNGPYTLVGSSEGLTSSPSTAISAVAPQLVVTGQPIGSITAGSNFNITVTVETSSGAIASNFSGTLDLSIASGPSGAKIGGATSEVVSEGVATFQGVLLDTAGTYFLEASGANATSGNTDQLSVVASSTVAALTIAKEPPTGVQAGAGFGLEVGGLDPYGNPTSLTANVTVALGAGPVGATLGGTTTVTPSDGVATFSGLTLDLVGSGYTLTAMSSGVTSATTTTIAVTAANAYQLAIPAGDEPPTSVDAGTPFGLSVEVEDQYGNLETGFSGTVTIVQPAGITGTTTATAVQGVATFTGLVLTKAGSYQLQATSGTLQAATSTSVQVVATSTQPSALAWATEPPGQVMDGSGFGAAVDVEDQYGNVETNFTGSVTIALDADPGKTTLGGTSTVDAVAGVATFSGLTLGADANGYTLVASSGGVSSPPSTAIDVSTIPPVLLDITSEPPTSIQDNQSFGLTVDVLDSSSVPDPDFDGDVTVSIAGASGGSGLLGKATVAASGGVATFSGLNLTQVGSFRLQVSTAGLSPVTTSSIAVSAGPATQLAVVTQPPASFVAGTAFDFEVQAEDQYGNVATGYDGLVTATLASNPENASLLGNDTALASGGYAYFTGVLLDRAGSGYTIEANDTADGLTGTTTTPITVSAGTPTLLEFSTPPPTRAVAGAPFTMTVGVADEYGNVVGSYTGDVTISLSNKQPAGALGGNLTEPIIGGLATFANLNLDKVATNYTILAQAGGVSSVTSAPISVAPAAASRLTISAQPPSIVSAGAQFGLAVTAEDAYGNVATGFNGDVTLGLNGSSGPATLSGSPLTVAASAGVASFPTDLAIHTAGSGFTLVATSPGLTSVQSDPVTVTALASTHLAVYSQPPSTLAAGAPFGLIIAAEDQYGNVDINFNGPITIALTPGSTAALAGTTQVTATAGLASFQGLTLASLTAPATITATSATLGSITTGSIAPTTTTVQQPPPPPPLVTMTGVQVVASKKHQVTEILITFSGALDAAEAGSTGEYELITAGKKNSFTAKNAKHIAIASAVYEASNDTVALTPSKKFVPSKPTELVVLGTAPSGLEDAEGRLIDGNDDGQAGSNATAILTKKGKTIGVTMAVRAASVTPTRVQGPLFRGRNLARRPLH